MKRLRLAIKKEEALQFLSHLDFARVVRLVVVRAALPVCYSEGFNPHMKLSFASALGVGVSASVEYMDIELTDEIPVTNIISRMNAVSPNGFAVTAGKYIDEKAPKLMAIANYSVYLLTGPTNQALSQAELQTLLDRFNAADQVLFEKVSPKRRKTHTVDIKQHVVEPITGKAGQQQVELTVGILQTEEGSVKPVEVWDVLGSQYGLPITTDWMLACRLGIYVRKDGLCHTLMGEEL